MQNIDELKQQALDAIFHFDIKEAKRIADEIDFQIKKISESPGNGREEVKEYSKLLVRLRLLALPLLKDEEAIRLIKSKAAEMVNDPDLDLLERVETRQITFPSSLRFEMVNQPLAEALHECEERIGEKRIFITGETSAVVPTVKNWLLDYDRTYNTGPRQDLVWLEYVKKNAFNARLAPEEAETLRKILRFYEFLKREHEIE